MELKMVKLELLKPTDNLQKIVEWGNGRSRDFFSQWTGRAYNYPLTVEQVENHINECITDENSSLYVYKIILLPQNEIIGTVDLSGINREDRSGVVRQFLICEEYRGNGYGQHTN
jgi:RimJ/RimL family protein N-acetyltransferase